MLTFANKLKKKEIIYKQSRGIIVIYKQVHYFDCLQRKDETYLIEIQRFLQIIV